MGNERYTHDETKEQGGQHNGVRFIDEYNGFLSLTNNEHWEAKNESSVRKYAQCSLKAIDGSAVESEESHKPR